MNSWNILIFIDSKLLNVICKPLFHRYWNKWFNSFQLSYISFQDKVLRYGMCYVGRHKNTSKRKDERRSGKGNPQKRDGDFYDVTHDTFRISIPNWMIYCLRKRQTSLYEFALLPVQKLSSLSNNRGQLIKTYIVKSL